MALEKRRGFHPNHKNIARLLTSDISDDIARDGAKSIRFMAQALAVGEAHDSGEYSRSFKMKKSRPMIRTTWGPHATWEVYNDDRAAAPNEFGGRGGAGPREARRILLRAAMTVHTPRRGMAKKVGRMGRGRT